MPKNPFQLYVKSTLDKYNVKLYPRAYRDLNDIYTYIVGNTLNTIIASNLINEIEIAIFSLENFPERGAIRQDGIYANKDYRQLFIVH